MLIYGVNPVLEALRSGRVTEVYICSHRKRPALREILDLCERGSIRVTWVERSFFSGFPKGHQFIAASVQRPPPLQIEDLFQITRQRGEPAFYLVIDSVQDPRNLGAILRTADATGVHGVVLPKRRVAHGPTVEKASAGAIYHLPLVVVSNIKHALNAFRQEGVFLYAAEAGSETLCWEVDLAGPFALVVGSESEGIKRTVRDMVDSIISLPMRGRVNSLNVSVATGVILYEALRQRLIRRGSFP